MLIATRPARTDGTPTLAGLHPQVLPGRRRPQTAITHLRRKEPQALPVNVVLFLIAALVAILRFGPYSY